MRHFEVDLLQLGVGVRGNHIFEFAAQMILCWCVVATGEIQMYVAFHMWMKEKGNKGEISLESEPHSTGYCSSQTLLLACIPATYAFAFRLATDPLQESHYRWRHVLLVHRIVTQDKAAGAEVHTASFALLGRLAAGAHFSTEDHRAQEENIRE